MPTINSDQMGALRQKEFWVAGSPFTYMSQVGDAPQVTTRNIPRYGVDEDFQDSYTSAGTFTATVATEPAVALLQIELAGYDPAVEQTGFQVDPDVAIGLPLWSNYRQPDNVRYWKAEYRGLWQPPGIGNETGGPLDTSMVQFAGGCDKPLQFLNGFLYGEKLATTSGSTGYTASGTRAFVVPTNGNNAVDVLGISGTGAGPLKVHQFSRGGAMMSAGGVVTANAKDYEEVAGWGGIPFFYVVKMHTGSGSYKLGNVPVAYDTLWTTI